MEFGARCENRGAKELAVLRFASQKPCGAQEYCILVRILSTRKNTICSQEYRILVKIPYTRKNTVYLENSQSLVAVSKCVTNSRFFLLIELRESEMFVDYKKYSFDNFSSYFHFKKVFKWFSEYWN